MATVLIRNPDDRVISRLEQRARQNHRSLQAELQIILERAAVAHSANAEEPKNTPTPPRWLPLIGGDETLRGPPERGHEMVDPGGPSPAAARLVLIGAGIMESMRGAPLTTSRHAT
jgi:antitoxin FitA-like protein